MHNLRYILLFRFYPGKLVVTLLILSLFFVSCNNKSATVYQPATDALFQSMTPSQTGIDFVNEVVDTKEFNVFKYRNFYNGGGVAIGDINNDGLPDIFLTANQKKNKLYLNKGNFKFEDVTDKAGVGGTKFWSTGATMADVNGDGWLDIYVCHSGDLKGKSRENELFINNHDGTFTESAKKYGLDEPDGLTTHAAFFDYDGDGDLDCYILNNSYRPTESFGYDRNLRNIRDPKGGDKLYRNDNGKFTDVSAAAGIYGSEIGFGLGITIGDVNGDKWPDIYVSNDFFERDYLYINQHNGTFKEVLEDEIGSISLNSMGADIGDINNDGLLDIFSTDMLPEDDYRLKTMTKFDNFDLFNAKLKNDFHHQFTRNMLQLNNGDGTFSEIGRLANVYQTDWSWGALMFDLDNDGWTDLFVSNGISKDLTDQDYIDYFASIVQKDHAQKELPDFKILLDKMKATKIANYAFINQHNLQFQNKSTQLGLAEPSFSNGAAYGDLDNDGDLDLIVNNENMPCFVYKNLSNEKKDFNYLKVQLKGTGMNTYGIGAEVKIFTKDGIQVREQMPSRGFESSVEPVLQFGLGSTTMVDSLCVIWPDQKMQVLTSLKSNQTIELKQSSANQLFQFQPPAGNTIFVRDSALIIGNADHAENAYVDFDRELLMPALLSSEGPKCVAGDVNGDGLSDMIIGGARNDKVKIAIQQKDGKFKVQTSPEIQLAKQFYEDAGLALFDVDGDHDLDLMIASGGNEPADQGMPILQTRLYINDGKGNFSNGLKKMPSIVTNASCVRPYDFDGDGDLDVFIGGRSTPGNYGKIPPSYILQNDGKGNFTDVTATIAPELQFAGMITDAVWADIDGDKKPELIICGEWMPVQAYSYTNGKFTRKNLGGINQYGWWNTMKAVDIDNDGDLDLIAGNLGLNSKFKADEKHPVEMYAGDFDNNGTPETVLTLYKNDSASYPLNLRGEMAAQMPVIKKKFLLYSSYAGKKLDQVFTPKQLSAATHYKADCMASCIFINDGKGNFIKKDLPIQAQFSPVYAIVADDFNNDGKTDIFLGGNFSGVKPEIGGYDANYGQLYFGDGKGNFTFIQPRQSGISIQGEVRDAVMMKNLKGDSFLVVAINNARPYIFKLRK